MAGTFGALAWGLQHYRESLAFAGVLANRVASTGHADMLEAGLRDASQWQGALMRSETAAVPHCRSPDGWLGRAGAGDAVQVPCVVRMVMAQVALFPIRQFPLPFRVQEPWATATIGK